WCARSGTGRGPGCAAGWSWPPGSTGRCSAARSRRPGGSRTPGGS
ncbi:MAG: hypothetical protein AVDCRST_MAG41-2882, partial [uncultured Corynebacteriales bacterium]